MCNRVNCLRIFSKVHFFLAVFSVKKNINRIHETESFIYFSIFSVREIWSLKPIPSGIVAPRGTPVCAAEFKVLSLLA